MDELMNSHLFPQIGKVIASTGSRHFPRMLHDLILTQLAVDATHITQLQVSREGLGRRKISPVYTDSAAALGSEQLAAQTTVLTRVAAPAQDAAGGVRALTAATDDAVRQIAAWAAAQIKP